MRRTIDRDRNVALILKLGSMGGGIVDITVERRADFDRNRHLNLILKPGSMGGEIVSVAIHFEGKVAPVRRVAVLKVTSLDRNRHADLILAPGSMGGEIRGDDDHGRVEVDHE